MLKAYLYPITARGDKEIYNPYTDDFMDSLEHDISFLNRKFPSEKGIFDLLKYLSKIDFLFLHWPENMAERKFGRVQALFLLFIIRFSDLLNIKIVYVLHNRVSHTRKRFRLKKRIFHTLLRHADLIITHAKDGLELIEKKTTRHGERFYFPHPVPDYSNVENDIKEIDVLLWGSVVPYKGIDKFLEKLHQNNITDWNVLIAGKASDMNYARKIEEHTRKNIIFINEFISDEKLSKYLNKSKIVLFPYHSESVLSSGALAYTSVKNVMLIGPHSGAFKDLSEEGYRNIKTFHSLDDALMVIEKCLKENNEKIQEDAIKIAQKYSWQEFGLRLEKIINQLKNN